MREPTPFNGNDSGRALKEDDRGPAPDIDEGPPVDLAQVHERYAPMLMSVLAALARKGVEVKYSDGVEVLHEFYAEALAGVLERYDRSQGKFSTYLHGAFIRHPFDALRVSAIANLDDDGQLAASNGSLAEPNQDIACLVVAAHMLHGCPDDLRLSCPRLRARDPWRYIK